MTDDNGHDDPTIAERAADAAGLNEEADEQEEMFPTGQLEGDGKTLKTLVKASQAVEHTVAMRSAEIPMRSGLLDPDNDTRVLVTLEVGAITTVPVREDGRVKSWKLRQTLRPTFVEPVKGDGAELVERLFLQVMEASPSEGGALAERVAQLAAEHLSAA